jgi:hypothetical protein
MIFRGSTTSSWPAKPPRSPRLLLGLLLLGLALLIVVKAATNGGARSVAR